MNFLDWNRLPWSFAINTRSGEDCNAFLKQNECYKMSKIYWIMLCELKAKNVSTISHFFPMFPKNIKYVHIHCWPKIWWYLLKYVYFRLSKHLVTTNYHVAFKCWFFLFVSLWINQRRQLYIVYVCSATPRYGKSPIQTLVSIHDVMSMNLTVKVNWSDCIIFYRESQILSWSKKWNCCEFLFVF